MRRRGRRSACPNDSHPPLSLPTHPHDSLLDDWQKEEKKYHSRKNKEKALGTMSSSARDEEGGRNPHDSILLQSSPPCPLFHFANPSPCRRWMDGKDPFCKFRRSPYLALSVQIPSPSACCDIHHPPFLLLPLSPSSHPARHTPGESVEDASRGRSLTIQRCPPPLPAKETLFPLSFFSFPQPPPPPF